MTKLITLLTALILGIIALASLYHVIILTPMTVGSSQLSLCATFLIYLGAGTFTAYLLRAGRKL